MAEHPNVNYRNEMVEIHDVDRRETAILLVTTRSLEFVT